MIHSTLLNNEAKKKKKHAEEDVNEFIPPFFSPNQKKGRKLHTIDLFKHRRSAVSNACNWSTVCLCNALFKTAAVLGMPFYCTALYFSASQCISLHGTVLHCIAQHCTALQRKVLAALCQCTCKFSYIHIFFSDVKVEPSKTTSIMIGIIRGCSWLT